MMVQHPLDAVVNCRATKHGRVYYVVCSDGRKAFVPESKLVELSMRFGDVIEVIK